MRFANLISLLVLALNVPQGKQITGMDKETKAKQKKNIIVEALKRCLSHDVYSKITVQDIADEAGFSKGGLLHYFPTKEEIYLELMNELFQEIEKDHIRVIEGNLKSQEKASVSALYGIEKFVLDKKTIRILINLVLYGYEDEKIMRHLREFIRIHLQLYKNIIEEARADTPFRKKSDFDPAFVARMAQIIVVSAGLMESIDPIDLDSIKLMKFIISLLRG